MADLSPDPRLHQPFHELAIALRSRSDEILRLWIDQVRQFVPSAHHLPSEQIQDNVPSILPSMADALEAGIGQENRTLMETSPKQGIRRFEQHYDVRDLMTEDRLLRRVIIEQVGTELGRRMSKAEQAALGTAIDLMLQQSVTAFVDKQKKQLRAATEAELKYLSFLSHDLNNNLGNITIMLEVLRQRLAASPDFTADVETIDAAQRAILDTIAGTGRLLESERLRRAGATPKRRPVNLHELITRTARHLSAAADKKGVNLSVEVSRDCECQSDSDLIGLILQNLIGNGVKYSIKGTVRIEASCSEADCVISVTDEGPGIDPEHLDRIFDSFQRGDSHGQGGMGLGLSIAAQAARLVGAKLGVKSRVGVGSTFVLALPR